MSIYVLRSDNLVKIGFTDNLAQRVQAIISSIPVPVEFVGHMPGGRDIEKHLHKMFEASNFSGEWYVESDAMRVVFDAILIKKIPITEKKDEAKRVKNMAFVAAWSRVLRQYADEKWPNVSATTRIELLAKDLGLGRARIKDIYYKNPKMSLRAEEVEKLSASLSWYGTALMEASR